MDRKTLAIVVLGVAFLVSTFGYIATSIRINNITAEKGEFMEKIRETENLAVELNKNIEDLRAILGKTREEKEKLAKEKEEMKKKLEEIKEQ